MVDGGSAGTAVRTDMPQNQISVVVLAAGKGTRMKSSLPKVLHPVLRRPMILHLLDTVKSVGADRAVVVIGPDGDVIGRAVAPALTPVQPVAQGTGDAVKAARGALEDFEGDIL